MGAIQGSINNMIGSVTAGIALGKKLGKGVEQPKEGIDAKMAAKARRVAQQKINNIYANKELSDKARTRRLGVVMDDYNKQLGGKQ